MVVPVADEVAEEEVDVDNAFFANPASLLVAYFKLGG